MPFASPSDVRTYTKAGKAVLTLVSDKTGCRYTFKVKQAKDRETGERQDRWFVSLLSGPNNEADYSYLGMIFGDAFRLTAKSRFAPTSTPVRAFQFFWKFIVLGQMPPQMTVEHAGHCGRCGRLLTVPESIANGIGPECMRKMGL